jgi:hypothetical protein
MRGLAGAELHATSPDRVIEANMGDPAQAQCGSRHAGLKAAKPILARVGTAFPFGGTEGSNPVPSSEESGANLAELVSVWCAMFHQ